MLAMTRKDLKLDFHKLRIEMPHVRQFEVCVTLIVSTDVLKGTFASEMNLQITVCFF